MLSNMLSNINISHLAAVNFEELDLEAGARWLIEAIENGNIGVLTYLADPRQDFGLKQYLSRQQHNGRIAEALLRCPNHYRREVRENLERLGLQRAGFIGFDNRLTQSIDQTGAVPDEHGCNVWPEDQDCNLRTPPSEGSLFVHVDSNSEGSDRNEAEFLNCTAGLSTIRHPTFARWKASDRNAIIQAYREFANGGPDNCRTGRLFCRRLAAEYGLKVSYSLLYKWLFASRRGRGNGVPGGIPLQKKIAYAELCIKQRQGRHGRKISFDGFSRQFTFAGRKTFSTYQISSWVKNIEYLKNRARARQRR